MKWNNTIKDGLSNRIDKVMTKTGTDTRYVQTVDNLLAEFNRVSLLPENDSTIEQAQNEFLDSLTKLEGAFNL